MQAATKAPLTCGSIKKMSTSHPFKDGSQSWWVAFSMSGSHRLQSLSRSARSSVENSALTSAVTLSSRGTSSVSKAGVHRLSSSARQSCSSTGLPLLAAATRC